MARKQIEITQQMIDEVERLSAIGLNESQISESIGIGYSTFQRYKEHFGEALKKGKAALRERVSNVLLSKMDGGDTTALIFMAKRLSLFQPSIEVKAPKTIKQAMEELTAVYSAHARGEITENQADKMVSILDKFIKGIELFEIEERLKIIEERGKNENNKKTS